MPSIKTFSLASMAYIAGVSTLPFPVSTEPSEPCPSTSIKADQSTILGWQLAGSITSVEQTCSQLENNQLQAWSDLGLNSTNIQTGLCGQTSASASISSSTSSNTEPFPNIVTANTEIMKTFLTSSFDTTNTTTFAYLCDSLSADQINSFFLDDTSIINATCTLGGAQLTPKAFTPLNGEVVNTTAVSEFQESQSKMFANLYAASASTSEELANLCQESSTESAQSAYSNLQLNAACVSGTICSIQEPVSTETTEQILKFWTTKSFLAFILNASSVDGYKKFLCDGLDAERMEGLGLFGEAAKEEVCRVAAEE